MVDTLISNPKTQCCAQLDVCKSTKGALVTTTIMAFPNPKAKIMLTTHASNITTGTVTEQLSTSRPRKRSQETVGSSEGTAGTEVMLAGK